MKNLTRSIVVIGFAALFGVLFWIVDGILNFYFFRDYLRFMLFERPETVFDSVLLNLSSYALFVRISFFTACIIGGIMTAVFLNRQKKSEEKIIALNEELEERVLDRTAQLSVANKELETFSYSVSHDLRSPLRSIDGFSQALQEEYEDKLDDTGKTYLERVRKATQNMGFLIDDMLKLSRVTRAEFNREAVDLSSMVRAIAQEHQKNNPERDVDVIIQKRTMVRGDTHLIKIAMENLVGNAWKFTGKEEHPKIEFGCTIKDGKTAYYVRDNGVGFDMAYVGKLFGAFQRLHTAQEFPGTGIGLATVQRIIHRHGGRIWAEGEIGKGATFYFTLPS